jgi:hypothetical protein
MNHTSFARITLICLALAGCAVLAVPTPQEARLSDQELSVTLNTGQICRAAWRSAPEGQICGFGYRVTEVSKPNLLRQLFTEMTTTLGAEGLLAPMAEVVLTSPQGQSYRFVSPPPVDMK